MYLHRENYLILVVSHQSEPGISQLMIQESPNHITIIDSMFTVSGQVVCQIESTAGLLQQGTRLIAENAEEWEVLSDSNPVRGAKHENIDKGLWHIYLLKYKKGIGHKPQINTKLLIVKDDE